MSADHTDDTRRILAHFDAAGVRVYQAFEPRTVQTAVAQGTFGVGFGFDRLSWIKPSFGWMLHRSAYATRHRQEAVARITVSHAGFLAILEQSVETMFDPNLFGSEAEWHRTLDASDVRHQWDPDRTLEGRPLHRRALQVGLRGGALRRYVSEWIVAVEDVTPLARAVGEAVARGERALPLVPEEREYPVGPKLARRLGMAL